MFTSCSAPCSAAPATHSPNFFAGGGFRKLASDSAQQSCARAIAPWEMLCHQQLPTNIRFIVLNLGLWLFGAAKCPLVTASVGGVGLRVSQCHSERACWLARRKSRHSARRSRRVHTSPSQNDPEPLSCTSPIVLDTFLGLVVFMLNPPRLFLIFYFCFDSVLTRLTFFGTFLRLHLSIHIR